MICFLSIVKGAIVRNSQSRPFIFLQQYNTPANGNPSRFHTDCILHCILHYLCNISIVSCSLYFLHHIFMTVFMIKAKVWVVIMKIFNIKAEIANYRSMKFSVPPKVVCFIVHHLCLLFILHH